MKNSEFNITFKGVEYIVEVTEWKGKKSVYVEYANLDEDIEEPELLNLTQYLIKEGFIKCGELE